MRTFTNILRTLSFFALVLITVYFFYLLSPALTGTLLAMLGVFVSPGYTVVHKWCGNVWVWLDQGFQTVYAPILNVLLQPSGTAMFGNPDETASSVVGKNLNTNNSFVYIDSVLSFFDKNSRQHAKDSIEIDERIDWRD